MAQKCKNILNRKESEKDLERALVHDVCEAGGHALKFSSNIETGYPDRIVLMPPCGDTYWVELKSEGEKPRLLQQVRHQELRELGCKVFVIDNTPKLNDFIKLICETRDRKVGELMKTSSKSRQ